MNRVPVPARASAASKFSSRSRLVRPYDYLLPPGLEAPPGSVVRVPLGSREVTGVVWETADASKTDIDPAKLKPVGAVLPVRPLTQTLRRLIDWVADYTVSAPGSVLRDGHVGARGFHRPADGNGLRLG